MLYELAILNPTVPNIIKRIDTTFIILTDSCKNNMPMVLINKIPNAPQIAYAIPISIVFSAYDKNRKHNK